MSNLENIKDLYIITTVINGKEKIAIDSHGIPLIYLSMDLVEDNKILENVQQWANESGSTFIFQKFVHDRTIDILEPMKTDAIM